MANLFQQPESSPQASVNILKRKPCRHFESRHSIVLANNLGPFLQKAIKKWFGLMKPKPFCRFIGSSTLLENAWKRATNCVDAQRVITVSTAYLEPYFLNYSDEVIPGQVLFQPKEAGSAPAIFLALAHILAHSPNSTVVIMPGDHFITPESLLNEKIEFACRAVDQDPNHAILLTATARNPSHEHCWIDASSTENHPPPIAAVSQIHSRITLAKANHLYRSGTNWYTGILVAKAEHLWQLGRKHLPRLVERMSAVEHTIRNVSDNFDADERIALSTSQAYHRLNDIDFFRHFLQLSVKSCNQLHLNGVDWDDWERPEQILQTIARYGFKVNFSTAESSTFG